ncbi:MAG: hypothetical protein ACRCYU_02855 [Nocardioides sp.]
MAPEDRLVGDGSDGRRAPEASALLEDYKLRIDFALNQLNRLQSQFQVLLTIEAAVLAAFVTAKNGALGGAAPWIAVLGVALSISWLMMGWVGRTRADALRKDLERAGRAWASSASMGDTWQPVGYGTSGVRVAVAAPLVVSLLWAALLVAL